MTATSVNTPGWMTPPKAILFSATPAVLERATTKSRNGNAITISVRRETIMSPEQPQELVAAERRVRAHDEQRLRAVLRRRRAEAARVGDDVSQRADRRPRVRVDRG